MFVPEHFTRTADFKVVHGKVKAASQIFEVLNGVQALLGIFGNRFFARSHQIRIGLMVAAAHASAQLVQLREAKHIRPVNEDGVGVSNINPRFNDRGTQKHVVALLIKVAHDVLEFSFAHLAVRDRNARFRQKL